MADEILQIEARMKNFISKELDKIDKDLKDLGESSENNFKRASKSANGFSQTLKGFVGAQAIIGGLKTSFNLIKREMVEVVNTASRFEMFQAQLAGVTQSSNEAAQALNALRDWARPTVVETEDAINTYIRLRAVGISPTISQLETLGGVSKLFGRDMADVGNALIGLESEVLRRLGIQLDMTGNKAKIMSGNMIAEVDKMDKAAMRSAILDIWEKRFPKSLDKAKETFSGAMSAFNSQITELRADVGEELLPGLKEGIEEFSFLVEDASKFVREHQEEIRTLGFFVGELIDLIVDSAKFAVDYYQTIAGGFETFISLMQTSVIKFLNVSVGTIATVVNKANNFADKLVPDELVDKINDISGGLEAADVESSKRLAELSKQNAENVKSLINAWRDGEREVTKSKKKIELPPGTAPTSTTPDVPDVKEKDTEKSNDRLQSILNQNSEIEKANREFQDAQLRMQFEGHDLEMNQLILKQERELEAIQGNNAAKKILKDKHLIEIAELEKEHEAEASQNRKIALREKIGTAERAFHVVSKFGRLAVRENKKNRALAKIGMAGEATMHAYLSANKALSTYGPTPLGYAQMAIAIATGLANVAQIATQKFASGTPYAPGGMALVGERGAEIVLGPKAGYLPRGSQVINNQETKNLLGGNNVNINISMPSNSVIDRNTTDDLMNRLERLKRDLQDGQSMGIFNLNEMVTA